MTVLGNGLNLAVPKLISYAIDSYRQQSLVLSTLLIEFSLVAAGIFIFGYLQTVTQTYASERVARDLRTRLVTRISAQDHAFIQQATPAKLLTNLTSDVDAVKTFVSQAIASIISSVFLIIGASILLLLLNWKLAIGVLAMLPIIGGTFSVVLGKVRKLFKKSQEAIDWLNKVINESILGSALIRLLNSQQYEYEKFVAANTEARDISLRILRLFASLIPVIIFCTNLATLMILTLGGRFVITGSMSLGNFTAFNSYLAILIFPVIVIGFMSTVIAQASASYMRISMVLNAPDRKETGTVVADLRGSVNVQDAVVSYAGKAVLKDVSFHAPAGTKTAIIGPTAAGKTQLLYLLTGLLRPESGSVEYDGVGIDALRKALAAPAGRLRLSGHHPVQSDAAGEHRLQQDRPRRGSGKGDCHRRAEGFRRQPAAEARHRGLRARHQPVGRPEAAHHAGARAGAESEGSAARRFHRASRHADRAQDSGERPPELSGNHADFGDAEDRLRRGLRSDRAADGRRGPGDRHAPATDGKIARICPDL